MNFQEIGGEIMNKKIINLFNVLWQDYIKVTPTALKIHELLGSKEHEDIVNDHIALRTFDIERVNLEKLSLHFKALGYQECGKYYFKEKKLLAKHYEHPDVIAPKVFISQLLLSEFSIILQELVKKFMRSVDDKAVYSQGFLSSGRHWDIDTKTYELLRRESEYAAWLYVWGFRANHFTVSVNHLKAFDSLEEVNVALKNAGFQLNSVGGEIKGSPELFLEQSSTLADEVLVEFSDKSIVIPSCFYEFALRYVTPKGTLFSGFVEASANQIFESTHKNT